MLAPACVALLLAVCHAYTTHTYGGVWVVCVCVAFVLQLVWTSVAVGRVMRRVEELAHTAHHSPHTQQHALTTAHNTPHHPQHTPPTLPPGVQVLVDGAALINEGRRQLNNTLHAASMLTHYIANARLVKRCVCVQAGLFVTMHGLYAWQIVRAFVSASEEGGENAARLTSSQFASGFVVAYTMAIHTGWLMGNAWHGVRGVV
jgi:hypothetical protein